MSVAKDRRSAEIATSLQGVVGKNLMPYLLRCGTRSTFTTCVVRDERHPLPIWYKSSLVHRAPVWTREQDVRRPGFEAVGVMGCCQRRLPACFLDGVEISAISIVAQPHHVTTRSSNPPTASRLAIYITILSK